MFTKVRAYVCAPLAVLALWVALLVVPPAVAEAQELGPARDTQGTNGAADAASPDDWGGSLDQTASDPPVTGDYESLELIVVRPGDSLWSISEERLGPEASAGQISNWAGQIYALNRRRIGGDPHLILPSQELLVPQAPPVAAEPAIGATAERVTKPAKKAASSSSEAPTRNAVSEKASKSPRNHRAELVALPGLPKKGATPEASSLVVKRTSVLGGAPSPGDSMAAVVDRGVAAIGSLLKVRHDERKLLGLACFAIAFGAAVGLGVSRHARYARGGFPREGARRKAYMGGITRTSTHSRASKDSQNRPRRSPMLSRIPTKLSKRGRMQPRLVPGLKRRAQGNRFWIGHHRK